MGRRIPTDTVGRRPAVYRSPQGPRNFRGRLRLPRKARHAFTFKNWQAVPVPADYRARFAYPDTVISASWDLSRNMDWAIEHGRMIHFNLFGQNLEETVAAYGKGGRTRSTDWELGRVVFGIKNGHIPRFQVTFWNGEKRLSFEEVEKLLKAFP